jgi:PAS domain S-box-containing protein
MKIKMTFTHQPSSSSPDPKSVSWINMLGIRGKLIAIFIVIKVIPLLVIGFIIWNNLQTLERDTNSQIVNLADSLQATIFDVGDKAIASSVNSLDDRSREAIERLSTDTAKTVASFLYNRDFDILFAANLQTDVLKYQNFLDSRQHGILQHGPWKLNPERNQWEQTEPMTEKEHTALPQLKENEKRFHARPVERGKIIITPLYLEMTFVDTKGMEQIKVTTSEMMENRCRDISMRENTWIKAEHYFDELLKLQPGEIYVSEVIGAYVPSKIIGPYTPIAAEKHGIPYQPEQAGYAGKENPVGKRFQGIVRWASPVVRQGVIVGYVTLALDHTHLMEFTDHLVPTKERYSSISDASTGNYAFMWDQLGRNISHPRDYFIVGYDPESGAPATPWLEDRLYTEWQTSGLSMADFLKQTPVFQNQGHDKKPSKELIAQGMVGLDCRYLNFAPQCAGWMNLTEHGGSGSFVIFWSNLWKLTTAATILYYTGQYGRTPRGFGFVTIGANIDAFHQPALAAKETLDVLIKSQTDEAAMQQEELITSITDSLFNASREIVITTIMMVVIVICIAFWMASYLSHRITVLINGIHRFQGSDMKYRLPVTSSDEIAELSHSFNTMAANIEKNFNNIKAKSQENIRLCQDLSRETKERREAETAFRTLYQKSTDGILIIKNGKFIDCNEAVVAMLGYEAKDKILNASPSSLSPEVQPDGRDSVEKAEELLQLCIEKGSNRFEWVHSKKNGENIWVEIVLTRLNMYGETVIHTAWRDISKLKKLKRERRQAQNLGSLGVLAGGIAHDFNNLLSAILGNLNLISLLVKNDNELDSMVGNAEKATIRAKNLTKQLLTFAKGGAPIRQTEQLLDMIKDSARFVLRGSNVNCIFHIPDDLWFAEVDKGQISQVIQNLVLNAQHAMPGGGEVTISCLNYIQEEPETAALTPGKYVQVEVHDNGSGISKNNIDQIFDPYFTTREFSKTKGNGLGLSIVHSIIQKHHGLITVDSEKSRGTTFTFFLPALTQPLGNQVDTNKRQEIPFESVKILLMDDDEMIQDVSRKMLQLLGHEVDIVANGTEAIKAFQKAEDEFVPYSIVILDLTIPGGMGGEATSLELLAIDPSLKLLVASGYSDDPIVANYREYGFAGSIVKPFHLEELDMIIREALVS